MEKAVLAGLIGSGSVLHLSLASSVPNIPFGQLVELIRESKQKDWSLTVVNMEYVRVSTTEGGKLLPDANYHVMLGKTPAESVRYAQKLSELMCGEGGFDLQFEEKSVADEALTNGRSILTMVRAQASQFVAEKYATSM
jgi:hypothetical protein